MVCPYGEKCYRRKNEKHMEKYLHDSDDTKKDEDKAEKKTKVLFYFIFISEIFPSPSMLIFICTKFPLSTL